MIKSFILDTLRNIFGYQLFEGKMIEERLKSFSLKELKAIAKHIGLKFDETDKEVLLEEIVEAYEENKLEKQLSTNLAMLMKSKKFSLVDDVDDFLFDQDDSEELIDLNLQKESKIHLMLRDPHWGFSYWSFCNTDLISIKRCEQGSEPWALFLRVFKCKEGESCKIKRKNYLEFEYFDITIDTEDYKWYINLPDIGCYYYVELYLSKGEQKSLEVLGKSNIIFSPLLRFDIKYCDNIDDALINSSIYQTILAPDMENVALLNSNKILTNEEQFYSDSETFDEVRS